MTRRLWTDVELADYLREELGFPGARQAVRLRRMAKTDLNLATGELAQERWYLLTRLPPGRCGGPADRLGLFRGHWSTENSRHHVKDRSWDEDRHTRRFPSQPDYRPPLWQTVLTLQSSWPNPRRQHLNIGFTGFR